MFDFKQEDGSEFNKSIRTHKTDKVFWVAFLHTHNFDISA